MDTTRRHRTYVIIAGSIVALAVFVFATVLFLPVAAFSDPTFLRPRTGATLLTSILMLGAAGMILSTLSRFKKSLRIAYILVACGIVAIAFSVTQLAVIGFFNAYNSWYVNYGVLIVPFIPSTALIYLGVRRFARLLEVRTLFTSFWFVTLLAIIASIISYITARAWARTLYIAGTDIYIATVAWTTVYAASAATLLRRISQRIGPFYHDALLWLYFALVALSVAGLHEHLSSYWFGNPDFYVSHGIATIPFIITGLLLLRAAYALCALSTPVIADEHAAETAASAAIPIQDSEYTNAITYAASLSSHPNDMDFILDDLRLVTASLKGGQPLSAEDKRRLINVYLKVELYLTYHDPLRNFRRDEVRSKLSPGLRAAIATHDAASQPQPVDEHETSKGAATGQPQPAPHS